MQIKYYSLFLIILISLNCSQVQTLTKNPFKHVIVLVMENHSYDTMLGFMDAPIGSLQEEVHCNYHKDKKFCQSPGADYKTNPDPGHIFPEVNQQLFNQMAQPEDPDQIPTMDGFANNYAIRGNPQNVFDCYTPEQVPIISTLAKTFTTYDNWFCSAPTQTDPNKLFVHAASSGGHLYNCLAWYCSTWPVELNTIEQQLQEEGYSWSIHWMDWCEAMAITPLNQETEKFIWDEQLYYLYKDMENGNLDDYTYIVPRIVTDTWEDPETGEEVHMPPNTQHPAEDVRNGEQLIKELYENLRKSKYWEDTLLLVTYDEHGGFYDHVVPPMGVSNPTPEQDQEFEWNRLGLRVPSIAISPWLKNTVNSTQFEHSSIPKTIREIFNLKSGPLTSREAESKGFITDDLILDEMRTDCPMTLPEVPFGNDSLYKYNPSNHPDTKQQYNGTPKTQLQLMGTLLVNKGVLNVLKFQQIADSIQNDEQAMQFVKEAQVLLGYRPTKNLKFQYMTEQMKIEE